MKLNEEQIKLAKEASESLPHKVYIEPNLPKIREFIQLGNVRIEPHRIVTYQSYDKKAIYFYYDGEFSDFRGWNYAWFISERERDDGLWKLDKIFIK